MWSLPFRIIHTGCANNSTIFVLSLVFVKSVVYKKLFVHFKRLVSSGGVGVSLSVF